MNLNKSRSLRLSKSSKIGQYLAKITLVAVAYFLGGKLAVSLPGVDLLGSSVWPPAGIAQAALLLLGIRYWPGVALGTFFFEILGIKPSLMLALPAAFGATLQAVFAVGVLHRLGFHTSLSRLKDAINFLVFGVIISTQINSTLGPLRMCLMGLVSWNQYWEVRWNWFLGDAMGVLIFTPLLLVLFQFKWEIRYPNLNLKYCKNCLVSIALLILLFTVSWIVFTAKTEAAISRYPLEYLPFPFIIWAAIQWGQSGAVLTSFLISCIAILGVINGGGPFIAKGATINQAMLFLQAFLGVITTTSLLLAATVTEGALAEDLLRKSEIKYRELVESGNSIILKLDTQAKISFFNEFAQQFFGFSEKEILGKSPIGTILEKNSTAEKTIAAMMTNILNNPELYQQIEQENLRKNGEKVWVSWSNKMLVDTQGSFIGIIAIGTDITERRKAELALENLNEELEIRVAERTATLATTEAELRALFAAMTDVILIVDRQGYCRKIVSTNPALLLKPLSEQVGKTLQEILPAAQADICFHHVQTALITQQTVNFEYSLLINNQQVCFSANISPLSEEQVIWVARDISDRKILEDKLRDSYSQLNAFLESMTDVILVIDSQANNIKVAPTNPQRLYPPEIDIISPTIEQFLVGENTEIFLSQIHQALETKEIVTFEYNLPIDETEYWFSASIAPLSEDSVIWVARDISDRKQAEAELRLEKERSEQLLLNILPEPIANRLKQDSSVIAESFNEVTIMFADLVGFTSLSTKLQPIELVNLLNEIFSTFDQLVEELGLEKIKTIGDAYMVAGGLPIPRIDHAEAIAELALTMLNIMQKFQLQINEELQIRIGINTGIVVAGVIGKKKFIYDLWGDAVNVASRMESHGIPGYIQVTEATYQRLKHKYLFAKRAEIHVKGKGKMTTYFLRGKKPI
ncbi:adenylate/guanylate cyclase domain-containing protein [Aerosakkonemataceae cyanobacterium BLCC-F154]|uniref:Adenylate/guanylate cyclase domain-containing protein n=1 Tax=Floridaenema fluviatile BLCC-F154 TaxID=3153640 RepID=A0ABV4YNH3_9CYAN